MNRARSTVAIALLATAAASAVAPALAPRTALAQDPPPQPKLTKPPKLVKFVEAAYPESEKASGKAASVVLRVHIDASGKVEKATIVTSAGLAFDDAAIAAVKQFEFTPAELDGKPAPIRIEYKYDFTLKVEAPKSTVDPKKKAYFEGVVRSRKDKRPLEGVTVELDTGEKAKTDAKGRFVFEPFGPGKRTVSLARSDLTTVQTEETFGGGEKLAATYDVDLRPASAANEPAIDLEILVVATPLARDVVSTEVTAEQGRKVPGTNGDVLKVVESLPGVARPAVGSGQLVVWGAAPEDTRVYVNDVRVPSLYHAGGLRSIVSSEFVRSVELAPGAYGSAYGRGIGGLVTVSLKKLEDDGLKGAVSADLIDTSAALKASVTKDVRAAIAARYGWLDRLVPLATDRDVGELFVIPRIFDAQARAAYALSPKADVEIGGFVSSDASTRTAGSVDPDERREEVRESGFTRVYARYVRETNAGERVAITPSVGTERRSTQARFGSALSAIGADAFTYALRATYRARASKSLVVSGGFDGEAVHTSLSRVGSPTLPAREGDVRVFGQRPSSERSADQWNTVIGSAAVFGELDLSAANDRVHLVPGLRVEPYVIATSRKVPVVGDQPAVGVFTHDLAVEPRLAAHVELSKRLRLKAAYGFYHQAPQPEDLSAVFGNPELATARAHHVLASASSKLTKTLAVETTGFTAISSDLVSRNPSDSPPTARGLLQFANGRAYGAVFLVRQELWKGFFGWISYTMLRSERKRAGEDRYRPSDYDQTHVLTALAAYDLGAGFEVGVRFRIATGVPRTPVTYAYYDARIDAYQPLFGEPSGVRLPTFVQLDARASKKWKLGKTTELEAYLDLQNVTNRGNPEEIVYSRDFTQQTTITGLPILPVVGSRLSW